jgi:hypothetical protein
MNKKRILLIVLFLIISIGLGYAVYKVFFAAPKAKVTLPTPKPGTSGGKFPEAGPNSGKTGTVKQPGELPTSGEIEKPVTSIPAEPKKMKLR